MKYNVSLLVDVAATHRLTRLVTADVIADPIRERIIRSAYVNAGRAEEAERSVLDRPDGWAVYAENDVFPPKLATLITCRWCASAWVALGVVAARRLVPRWWDPLARGLALSSAGTLLAGLERD